MLNRPHASRTMPTAMSTQPHQGMPFFDGACCCGGAYPYPIAYAGGWPYGGMLGALQACSAATRPACASTGAHSSYFGPENRYSSPFFVMMGRTFLDETTFNGAKVANCPSGR